MGKKLLLVAAAAFGAASAGAQAPATPSAGPVLGWTPPAGLVTMPIWPGTPPGANAQPAARRRRTIQNDGRPALHSPDQCVHADDHGVPGEGQEHGRGSRSVSWRRLSDSVDGSRRHGSLRLAELDRRELRAAQISRARQRAVSEARRRRLKMRSAPLGLVRQHATEWGIDPQPRGRDGIFRGRASCGRPSATTTTSGFTQPHRRRRPAELPSGFRRGALSRLPGAGEQNFAPNPDIQPTANTPPTFLLQAENDYTAHVESSVVYFMQLKNAKVPAELHIYAQGGHGFGLRPRDLPDHGLAQAGGDVAAHDQGAAGAMRK